jgi:hypothetical protein
VVGTDRVSARGCVPGYHPDRFRLLRLLIVERICVLCGRVVISRMYIMDNILFSTKKEIINNFPIESTHPPHSTHGGSFELPNTLNVYIGYLRRCGDTALAFCPLSYLREKCISRKNYRL